MKLTVFFLLPLLISCNDKINNGEKVSINGVDISKYLLTEIEREAGKKFEARRKAFWVNDATAENGIRKADSIVNGIQITFVKENQARTIVRNYLSKFEQSGYYIYLKNLDFDKEFAIYYDVVVIKCKDQFELVKLAETSGLNYDVTNDDVVDRLKLWHKQSPFTIIVADEDRIEADFIRVPADLREFAKEVHDFCPDVIEQGAGSEQELIEYFKKEQSFWLWWD